METFNDVLTQILRTVQAVQHDQKQLAEDVLSINRRLEVLGRQQGEKIGNTGITKDVLDTSKQDPIKPLPAVTLTNSPTLPSLDGSPKAASNDKTASSQRSTATSLSSRIILTTYPGQAGIDPISMNWGHYDQMQRGPVVVSRSQSTIKRRNGMPLFTYEACRPL